MPDPGSMCLMGAALGASLKLVDDIYDESLLGGPGSHPSLLIQAVFVSVSVGLTHASPAWALCATVSCMACALAGQMDEWVYLAVYLTSCTAAMTWARRGAYRFGMRELGLVLLAAGSLVSFVLWEQRAFDDQHPDVAYRRRKRRYRCGFALVGFAWSALLVHHPQLLLKYMPHMGAATASMAMASTAYMATSAALLGVA